MREDTPPRQVVWTGSYPPGVELCTAKESGKGWTMTGTIARLQKGGIDVVSYAVETDRSWKTRKVTVEQKSGGTIRRVSLGVRGGRWFVRGSEEGALSGCVDVDLQASPATNTLPLKRARPKIGAVLDLKAAWVRFPSLKVEPLRQSYERVGARTYIYRSGGFESELEVDSFGFVRRYGRYWSAV